ncbi:MAG TPA: FAD-dependent oxidoreductase [Ilumatobacter sp.]|nr:FAD-dependent oxidoreductase [Ilumatobacter sp.]
MTVESVDALVVGAGIAGFGVAADLAADRSVLVIEQFDTATSQTTGRSAAQFIAGYGGAQIQPFSLASHEWFASGGGEVATLLEPRGMLTIASVADDAVLHSDGDEVSVTAALELCPALRPERIAGAWYDERVFDIDVAEAVTVFRRVARRHGAEIRLGCRIVSAERVGERWLVTTSQGTIEAGTIVNAAGAWADEVARASGVPPCGLVPMRRTACTFRYKGTVDHRAWPLVFSAAEAWYFKPEPGQIMASLADETPTEPSDVRPEEEDLALCLDRINEETTLAPRSLSSSWAGLRTFAPDRGFVLGPDPLEPSFVWCAGQGGFGIQAAPAVSESVGTLMRTGELPPAVLAGGATAAAVSAGRFVR